MTEQLKYVAQECKDIRGLPPHWYDFDTLAITYGIGHTDAMFIAAASPDVVLALIAERDEYQRAADTMAASHKVERDALLDSRHEDEALMREALKAINCTTLKCSDFHHKKADQHHHSDVCKPMIQYEIVLDKLRARLGDV